MFSTGMWTNVSQIQNRCVTVGVFADKSLNFTVRLVAGGRAGAFATSDYA